MSAWISIGLNAEVNHACKLCSVLLLLQFFLEKRGNVESIFSRLNGGECQICFRTFLEIGCGVVLLLVMRVYSFLFLLSIRVS